jgi:hypothetical protein
MSTASLLGSSSKALRDRLYRDIASTARLTKVSGMRGIEYLVSPMATSRCRRGVRGRETAASQRGLPGRTIRGHLGISDGRRLFSFDFPERVLSQHADREAARKLARPQLTPDSLSEIHVSLFSVGTARIVRLVLDSDWTEHVCRSLALRADIESAQNAAITKVSKGSFKRCPVSVKKCRNHGRTLGQRRCAPGNRGAAAHHL